MATQKENDNVKRVNIFVNVKVKEWYQKRARDYGMSMSALMSMAMTEWKEQKETMSVMKSKQLTDMVRMLEEHKQND